MTDKDPFQLFVEEAEASLRLDTLLASRFTSTHSRTYFQKLIEEGLVLLNGQPVKKRIKPTVGDEIEVEFALSDEIDLVPENIPLDILYEDEHLIAVNKPASMVVHPAPGNPKGTFVNALLYHCKNLPLSDSIRPGIVHRLDKDTSGVLIAAKTSLAHQKLVELFSSRQINKRYLAICVGTAKTQVIETSIGRDPKDRQKMAVVESGGRIAKTGIRVLQVKEGVSLVELDLFTGRTHQIRVHLRHVGTPVLGDAVYGSAKVNKQMGIERQLLHALHLSFKHPITGKPLEIEAALPPDFEQLKRKIFL